MTINWKNIIEIIKEELKIYHQQGYKSILRSIFYRLYSKSLIPNTTSSYSSLVRATVKAREDHRLPIDCFTDNTRQVRENFNEIYCTPSGYIDRYLRHIKDISKEYLNFIPIWHNQPEYVEVWIEKDAMVSSLASILEGKDVRILAHKGFTSLTFLSKCVNRLNNYIQKGKNIHILYYGDFDPSGEYMVDDLRSRMQDLGLSLDKIDFQKIAVTPEQIKKYSLPFNPDKTTTEKMNRDSRTNGFIEKYGKLYAVELDALPALIPDEFRKMVFNSVDQFYDQGIYEKVLTQYSTEQIEELLKLKIVQFLDEI